MRKKKLKKHIPSNNYNHKELIKFLSFDLNRFLKKHKDVEIYVSPYPVSVISLKNKTSELCYSMYLHDKKTGECSREIYTNVQSVIGDYYNE